MDNKNSVVVRREWVQVALDIIRFFFQHSTIEIDGTSRKARVNYHGPNGWNVSIDSSLTPGLQLDRNSIGLDQMEE